MRHLRDRTTGDPVIDNPVKDPSQSTKEAEVFFAKLKDRLHRDKKPTEFMPYVMMRSCVGDNGSRPLPVNSPPFWESPDIWTWAGDPSVAPDIPPDQGGTVSVGGNYTLYAHVWNLGRAPIAGARVEWYWFHPFLGIDSSHANLVGVEQVELSPRGFPGCHKLVKCPNPYVVQPLINDHPCLVARVSAFGDPLNSAHEWDAWADRHVAQKNLTVVSVMADVQNLLRSLDATRPALSTVRLFQVGQEAAHSLDLIAPHLKIDPTVKTALLAELNPTGRLTLPPLTPSVPRIIPHLLLDLGNKPAASTRTRKPESAVGSNILHEKADVPMLVRHAHLMSPEMLQQLEKSPLPEKGLAHVLRIVAYNGEQQVGGYTIIVGNPQTM